MGELAAVTVLSLILGVIGAICGRVLIEYDDQKIDYTVGGFMIGVACIWFSYGCVHAIKWAASI